MAAIKAAIAIYDQLTLSNKEEYLDELCKSLQTHHTCFQEAAINKMALFFFSQLDDNKKEAYIDMLCDAFPNSIPEKGTGYISLAQGDIEKAKDILKEHVGEFEWGYYPNGDTHHEGLIQSGEDGFEIYYGKFEIDELQRYFRSLLLAGVTLNGFLFAPQDNF